MIVKDETLLAQFRIGPCEWCGKRGATEAHHIFTRGMGCGRRLDVRINLIGLCRVCHALTHNGAEPTKWDLLAIVARREGMVQDGQNKLIAEIRRLMRLDKHGEEARRRESPPDPDHNRENQAEVCHDHLPGPVPPPGGLGRPGVEIDEGGWHDL